MSVERAREFLHAASADSASRMRLESAASFEAVLETMQVAGYGDVTADDLKSAVSEGDLSDAELEGAAGGCGVCDAYYTAYAVYSIVKATVKGMIP